MVALGPILILFDIDGTLVSTGGRAAAALRSAMEQEFGRPVTTQGYSFAGKTDPQIIFELSTGAGLRRAQVEPRLPAVFARYLELLHTALPPGGATALPGTRELLADLRGRPEVTLGLLTGNLAEGARIKLRAAGFDDGFSCGAYGSDSEDRNLLVPVAWERAAAVTGRRFSPGNTVVVGDAEADIACARAAGARVAAVTTGWTSRERLAALQPDALLESLAVPDAADIILRTTGSRELSRTTP